MPPPFLPAAVGRSGPRFDAVKVARRQACGHGPGSTAPEFALRCSLPPLTPTRCTCGFGGMHSAAGREGESAALQRLRYRWGAYCRCGAGGARTCVAKHPRPRLTCRGAGSTQLASGDCVAAVVAAGVDPADAELPRRSRAYPGPAQRYFDAGGEAAVAGRAVLDKREVAFGALWTGKEAVLKADGGARPTACSARGVPDRCGGQPRSPAPRRGRGRAGGRPAGAPFPPGGRRPRRRGMAWPATAHSAPIGSTAETRRPRHGRGCGCGAIRLTSLAQGSSQAPIPCGSCCATCCC